MHLKAHGTCSYDWVMIVDGDGSVLLPKKCGSEIPAPVTTNTNTAVVMFHSDGSETKQGFKLKWSTVAPVQSGYFWLQNLEKRAVIILERSYTIFSV